jgi:hypothetical protein
MTIQRSRFFYLLSIFWLILSFKVYPQSVITIPALNTAPVVDGIIERSEWTGADSINRFTQMEPIRGQPATRETTVFVGQFEGKIYFAFQCAANSRGEIVAKIQRRDQADDSDDVVAILLDTYYDKQNAYLFMVNPIGTLTDIKVTDDGKNVDFFWDTEWEAHTTIDDTSWNAEIVIPFDKIQYNPKADTWGLNVGRVIRANLETTWWSEVTENFRVSQSGIMTGINPQNLRKSSMILFPYGTLRYENSDITEVYGEVNADAGADLLFNVGSNFITNLTYNPDFATVEGDKEQINLTPWEIRFPDKRLFFQDGNEMFQTRIQNFYSRRIGDMQFGGKAIGKVGKYQFNGLFARTEEDIDLEEPKAWFNTLRIKRDILRSSNIGLTYADKIWDGGYARSLSFDYVLNLGKTWKFTGQFVGSAPGDFASHSAWYVRFARENNIYHYHIRYSNFGKNFQENVNQTGFIRDDDRHELDGDIRYRWWFSKKLSYFEVFGKNNIFWSQEGILRSWYVTYGTRIYTQNRLSFDFNYNNEYKLFDKEYYNHFYRFIVGYNTDEWAFAKAGYTFGRNFDRDFQLWNTAFQVRLFKDLSMSYELNALKYITDTTKSTSFINVLSLDYFFTKDLWIRVFTQNNSSFNKYYFYGLFGWRFKPPFGAVYLIVSADKYDETEPEVTEIHSNIVFLKLTYPITIFK